MRQKVLVQKKNRLNCKVLGEARNFLLWRRGREASFLRRFSGFALSSFW
jgi:hypothetical protein